METAHAEEAPAPAPSFAPSEALGAYAELLNKKAQAEVLAVQRAAEERKLREQDRPSFQRTGDPSVDGQLEMLYRELKDQESAEARVLFLRRIAEVYVAKAHEVKLEAGRRLRGFAKEALLAARKENANSLPVARALRHLYELEGDWLAALEEADREDALSAGKASKESRAEVLLSKGRAAEQVGEDEKAVAAYRQILTMDGKSLPALQGLDSAYTRMHAWEPLIDVLEREAQLLKGTEEQAQIQYRLGQVLARFLAERPPATGGDVASQVFVNKVIGCFRSAADLSANPVPALAALRQIYARFGKWDDFLEISERLVERTEQTAAKVYFLYHNGRIHLEKFQNAAGALPCFERILQIDPGNLLTLKALEAIHTERQDARGLVQVLERQVAAVDDQAQKALLSLRIGRIYEESFDQPDHAIEWYSRALEIDSKNLGVLQALGKLHARNKDWEKLEQVFAFEAEACGDARQKVEFLLKRAELHVSQFEDVDGAINILFEALRTDDSNLAIYRELGRLLALRKRWAELIRLYEAEATLTKDKDRLIAIHMSLGELWQRDFDPPEPVDKKAKAIECFYRVLDLDPAHAPALRTLGKIFAQQKDWGRLLEVYSLEVELASSVPQKISIYLKMSQVEEEHSRNNERAMHYLRKALELDPHDRAALAGIARLAPRLNQWDDLLQVYIRDAELSQDLKHVAALHQLIGQLWRERFALPAKSQESFRRASQLQSGNIVALRSLEEQFESEGNWQSLCEILLEDLSESPERDQKVVLLKRLAEVSESRVGDRTKAAEYYERLAEIDPGNFDALEHAARLWGETGDWPRQAQALEGLLKVAKDPAYLAQVHLTFARLLAQRRPLDNSQEKAIASLGVVLQHDPKNREALALHASLLHELKRWDELAAVLRRRIELGDDEANRAHLHRWLGRALLEGSGSGEHAADALKEALRLEPGDLPTRTELARACEKAGWHEDAASQFDTLRNEMHDVDRKRALSVDLARVLHERLKRHDEAVGILQDILSQEPDHAGAQELLGKIVGEQGRWDEAITLTERRYALTPEGRGRIPVLLELAHLWDERKGNADRAAECGAIALSIDEEHLGALLYLGDLEYRRGNAKRWCELDEKELSLLAGKADAPANADRIHLLRRRLAEGYRDHLSNRKRAREHLKKAVDAKPGDLESRRDLEKLYAADLMWEELASALSERAERSPSEDEKVALFVEAAHTWRDRSQAAEASKQAVKEYERALIVRPADAAVLTELSALCEKLGDFARAAEILERLADALPEEKRAEPLARAGKLYETKIEDTQRAADLYGEALEINANLLAAAEPLAELLWQQKNWRQCLQLFERLSRLALEGYSPDRRARFLYQYGTVLENLGQDEQAIDRYQKAIKIRPHSLEPVTALAALYERRRNWKELAPALQSLAEALETNGKKDELPPVYFRAGQAHERLRNVPAALDHYRKAVAGDASLAAAHEAIAHLSLEKGEIKAAADAYGQAAQANLSAGETEQAASNFFTQGEILLGKLSLPAEAAQAFGKALDADPTQVEALDRFARASMQASQFETARRALEKLVKSGAKGTQLADYETFLGRIALQGGGVKEAILHLEAALEAEPKHRPAHEALGELYEKESRWTDAAQIYQKFIELVQKDAPRSAGPIHNRLGDLYREKISRPEEAITEYRKSIRLDPTSEYPHARLAQIFEGADNSLGDAVREHTALLALNPFRFETHHRLFSIYERQRAFDKTFCVSQILAATGKGNESEMLFYQAQQRRNPLAPAQNFETSELLFKVLAHPLCQHGAGDVLQILGPAAARLMNATPDRLGVTKNDKVAPDDASALAQLLRRAVQFIGNPPCDIYWMRRRPKDLVVFPAAGKPLILAGPEFLSGIEDTSARAGKVGAALWPLADGSYALPTEAPQIARFVALLGKSLDDNFKVGGDPEQIKQEIKLLHKDMTRKQKKDAEALLGRLKEALGRLNAENWKRGIQLSADRLGLLFSNSFARALDRAITRTPGFEEKSAADISDWNESFGQHEAIRELVRFAASEEYFALRTKLGLSILSAQPQAGGG
ncbi:MAG: tetratricopeptide repeat protein [Bdellovibrionota bacterium]